MQYLNRKEQRLVNATGNYAPRKLTQIEQVIKHLRVVQQMEPGKKKDAEATQTLRILEGLTSSESLMGKAKLAMYSEAILNEVTEMYPYVEFEEIINGNDAHLVPPLVKAAQRGISVGELRDAVTWLDSFKALLHDLPTEFGEFYIGTPNTKYSMVRTKATLHNCPAAFGLVLTPELQARVDALFENTEFYNHPLVHINEYQLHTINRIHERLKMEPPMPHTSGTPTYAFSLKFWTDEIPTKIFERENPMSRTITVFKTQYPILSDDSVKPVFHFQY